MPNWAARHRRLAVGIRLVAAFAVEVAIIATFYGFTVRAMAAAVLLGTMLFGLNEMRRRKHRQSIP